VKVRIEGSGHCVEIEADDGISPTALTGLAERTWEKTRVTETRMPFGYGAQHMERKPEYDGFSWRMGEGEQPAVTA
jgi:hypothetical protein